MNPDIKKSRKSIRNICKDETKFYVNADIINAEALDQSDTGIRIKTKEPITIHMKIGKDEDAKIQVAKLIWAEKNNDGTVSYGLEFSSEPVVEIF